MSHSPNTEDETMYLIEGTLSGLIGSAGKVNVLKQLKVGSTTTNVAAGIVGVIGGVSSLVSNAALLESYDGEDVENFTCRIGEYVIFGQFSGAMLLKEGDQVKAVVSRNGDSLLAHAILRPKDELLWLPIATNKGSRAEHTQQMKSVMKSFGVVSLIALVLLSIITSGTPFPLFFYFLVVGLIIFLVVGAWTVHDLLPLSQRAEQIFTVLGFPDVENLDMSEGSYAYHHGELALSVYYYQCVLDAHRTGQAVQITVPAQSLEITRGRAHVDDQEVSMQEEKATADEASLFLIEGTISNFIRSPSNARLLELIREEGTSSQQVADATRALAGLVNDEVTLEKYDREYGQHFSCHLGGHVVMGQFSGAFLLNEGDDVKAVVSRSGNTLLAHAIVRPKDELLWLPRATNKGSAALQDGLKKLAFWSTVVVTGVFSLIVIVDKYPIEYILYMFLMCALTTFLVSTLVSNAKQPQALRAEKLFSVLGFPDVEKIDMSKGSYAAHHHDDEDSIYYYQCVLDARRTGKKVHIAVQPHYIEREREAANKDTDD